LICDIADGATKGQCVQCKSDRLDKCKADSVQYSCDFETHECTKTEVGKTEICGACRSDAECKTGAVCVESTWDTDADAETPNVSIGWFCQWREGGGGDAPALCNSSARPFAGKKTVRSADDAEAKTICVLRAASCQAHQTFSNSCGRYGDGPDSRVVEDITLEADGTPINPPLSADQIKPDDSLCGYGGKCVPQDDSVGAYQCTVSCLNSSNDCPVGPVNCGGDPPGIGGFCSLM
jgi:hypothetical protein